MMVLETKRRTETGVRGLLSKEYSWCRGQKKLGEFQQRIASKLSN